MERTLKLQLTESAFVKSAMVKEVKKALYRSVVLARAEEWSSECSNLVLECTHSLKDLAMIAVEKVRSLTTPTSVRPVTQRKL